MTAPPRPSLITFEERSSDSPFVERVWRSHSDRSGTFSSIAACHWDIVVVRLGARPSVIVRGPETEQRRFLRSTGLPRGAILQIERARRATRLLRQGRSILDATHQAGYYDQAHLTRSLKRWIGQTPARVGRPDQQLSFLYNP